MRHALLALALLLCACGDDGDSCGDACKTTQTKYALNERTIHAVDEKTFADEDGIAYTLVRIEFGDTEECDDGGGDCGYSTYCGFVVDGEVYPVDYYFVTDEDALFDDDTDLTGNDLEIFDDEEFDEWLWETDSEDDILISCFDGY